MTTYLREDIPWLGDASSEEMKRVIEALYRVHGLTAAMTDLDSLLLRISEESKQVAGAEACSVMLYDEHSQELYFRIAIGETGDQENLKQTVRLKLDQGIAGATAASRESITVPDVQSDPRFFSDADAASQFTTRNLLAVPMLDHNRLVGVLEVLNKVDGDAFTPLDMRVMEMFSNLAATAVTSARLIEERIRNERFAVIGQAVTGLSHYTKNIVTGLNSSGDLIEMGLNNDNLQILKRTWPAFRRSVKRISNFVQDMLSFSKPRKPVREKQEVAALIEEARETLGEFFTQQHIEVTVDTSGVIEPVYVDGPSIYRGLLNLLTNAAEAVPREGGQIKITAASPQPGSVELWLEDNGPGVATEHRPHIFTPFFSTKGSQGTGLGLAVTAKVIEEHGGTIALAQSSLGGAAFHIILPTCTSSSGGSISP